MSFCTLGRAGGEVEYYAGLYRATLVVTVVLPAWVPRTPAAAAKAWVQTWALAAAIGGEQ